MKPSESFNNFSLSVVNISKPLIIDHVMEACLKLFMFEISNHRPLREL
jgi:hypothetical protein